MATVVSVYFKSLNQCTPQKYEQTGVFMHMGLSHEVGHVNVTYVHFYHLYGDTFLTGISS